MTVEQLLARYAETADQLLASGYSETRVVILLLRKAERDGLVSKETVT